MAVPTPAFSSNDITDNGSWTLAGSPSEVVGQHSASTTAINFDGVNDKTTASGSEILTSGTTGTVAIWARFTTTSTLSLMNERIAATANGWYIRTLGGGVQISFSNSGSLLIRSESAANGLNDGEWHYIVGVVRSASDVDIYIDGVEETAYANQNVGTGWTGHSTVGSTIIIGTNTNGSIPYVGDGDRPRVWTEALTSAQVLEQYNSEVAATYIPTPSFTSNDLTSGWTEQNSPTYVADNINTTCSLSFEGGGTKRLEHASKLIAEGQTTFMVSYWYKSVDTTGLAISPWGQSRTGAAQGLQPNVEAAGGTTRLLGYSAASGAAGIRSVNSAPIDDENWHHIMMGITNDGTGNCNVYVDGVEAYSAQDVLIGAGWTSLYASGSVTTIGAAGDTGLSPSHADIARFRVWDGEFLSFAQGKKVYDTEFALIGTDPDCPVAAGFSLAQKQMLLLSS